LCLTCTQSPRPDRQYFLSCPHSFYCHHFCSRHLYLPPRPLQYPLNCSPVLPLSIHYILHATSSHAVP
jgi:hypothetical protein